MFGDGLNEAQKAMVVKALTVSQLAKLKGLGCQSARDGRMRIVTVSYSKKGIFTGKPISGFLTADEALAELTK